MAIEHEARFQLPEDRLESTINNLCTDATLTPFILVAQGAKVHTDTYFDDSNRSLFRRKWSLRLRQSASWPRVTLKRPASQPGKKVGDLREEIENRDNATLVDTIMMIAAELAASGVARSPSADLPNNIILNGVHATMAALGLLDLFTVRTTRHTWMVRQGEQNVAELAVDDSQYEVGTTSQRGFVRECRIEVELLDPARTEDLRAICTQLLARFDLREVHDSKYERGMLHASTRGLREKLELKITVTGEADYEAIIDRFENPDSSFLPQYKFGEIGERQISDIYYDTEDLQLFHAGHYLRLREDKDARELVFRRLTQDVQYGEVLQEEYIAKGRGEEFVQKWEPIREWLTSSVGQPIHADVAELGDVPSGLLSSGIRPRLRVGIERRAWAVQRAGGWQERDTPSDHVAILKYDRVATYDPDHPGLSLHSREFEATGIERDDGVPLGMNILSYDVFVNEFMEACAHTVADHKVDRKINAKYFQGIVGLGITKVIPDWFSDQRLSLRVSLLRATPGRLSEPRFEVEKRVLEDTKTSVSELRHVLDDAMRSVAGGNDHLLGRFMASVDDRISKIETVIDRLAAPGVNLTVIQNTSQSSALDASTTLDMDVVARELSVVLKRASQDGLDVGSDQVAALVAARDAARQGDETAVVGNLRKVAGYLGGIISQVSVPVIQALVEQRLVGQHQLVTSFASPLVVALSGDGLVAAAPG